MHYFGISQHTQSMTAYKTLSISGNSNEDMHCDIVGMLLTTCQSLSAQRKPRLM